MINRLNNIYIIKQNQVISRSRIEFHLETWMFILYLVYCKKVGIADLLKSIGGNDLLLSLTCIFSLSYDKGD